MDQPISIAQSAGEPIPGAHFTLLRREEQIQESDSASKRGRRGRKPKAVEGVLSAPKRARSSNDEADLIAAMEALKPLVASLGVDRVKRLTELLG